MKRGKNICHQLKAVRRQIADENGIELHQPECTYEGECRGTCPRCEYELHYLERELSRRQALGKAVTVAGISLGLASCGGGTASSPKMSVPTVEEQEIIVTGGEDEYLDSIVSGGLVIDTSSKPHFIVVGKPLVDRSFSDDGLMIPKEEEEVKEEEEQEEKEILVGMVDEKYPEFPGGEDSLYAFLARNIRFPHSEASVQGTVVIKFVVEKDGSITNASILRDIGGGCGEEALRVVNMMPKWKPGTTLNGEPIRTEYVLPIQFQIE
jgi:TonB family protein